MSHSAAWADIQPTVTTPTSNKNQSYDNIIVSTTIDMLDVAKLQSETSYGLIPLFFSRIDGILDHLVRIDMIHSQKQSKHFREKIMEILGIPEIGNHIELHTFFKKHYTYQDRFSLSLKLIKEKMQEGKTLQDAIDDRWFSGDKGFFGYDLTNLTAYTRLMKTYSIQKYGKIPSKK